jgi:sulfur relay (sulfurtransferase) complex TusBCD TusD component (DsrE family)
LEKGCELKFTAFFFLPAIVVAISQLNSPMKQECQNGRRRKSLVDTKSAKIKCNFRVAPARGTLCQAREQNLYLKLIMDLLVAFEKIATMADKTPSTIHKALSKHGNPTLATLTAVLKTMGLKLSVEKAS